MPIRTARRDTYRATHFIMLVVSTSASVEYNLPYRDAYLSTNALHRE
jgi:hypothetical protein